MDKAGIADTLSKELSAACTCFDRDFADPEFQEELAVCDEELLAGFLEGRCVSQKDAVRLVNNRMCFPVIFGSALKLEGVKYF